MRKPELQIVQQAEIPPGVVFWFWGRPLRVVFCEGTDAAAPVILEEMGEGRWGANHGLAGQLSMWSLDGVRRVMDRNTKKPRGVLRSVR